MKTAVVTGSNRGIGLEFCKQLKEGGYHVAALCRKAGPELKSLNVQIFENVDVTDTKALAKVAGELDSIDLLVNNAGILINDSFEDKDSILKQLEVNSVGPLTVTAAFLSLLGKGSKIAMITSRMGSIGDNTSGGFYGYRMSKAALNMAGVSLSLDFKDKGISVGILHPGYVETDMTDNQGAISPEESVRGMLKNIERLDLGSSGSFWHYQGSVIPW
jgi:NAD(P)-dependent dehydrogenase (short-subunit alcohol dehydrogenase family)